MRWENLFSDLEGQLSSERDAQFQADVAELTRAERASVDLASRLVASRGMDLRIGLVGGEAIADVVTDASAQWLLLGASSTQTLVPLTAIASVHGLAARTAVVTEVERRLSLGHALRALSRDRARVVANTAGGDVSGVVGAVGADHVDIATSDSVAVTVPFAAIRWVRSAPG